MGDYWDVDQLYGSREGDTIIVVGTSDSLNELDLELLSQFTLIGTNDALGRFATKGLNVPEYLLTAEVVPVQRAMIDLHEHPEVRLITRERCADYARAKGFEGPIYLYDLTTKSPRPTLKGPLRQENNTAHYATQVAARMRGTTRPGYIALAGVDLRYPTEEEIKEGKQNHYWGDGQIDGCKPHFDTAIRAFPELAKWLGGRGMKLVTLSPWDGPLTEFLPRVNLGDLPFKS